MLLLGNNGNHKISTACVFQEELIDTKFADFGEGLVTAFFKVLLTM